jgi:pimeloyl-ACP methyl ester carboxylesterase
LAQSAQVETGFAEVNGARLYYEIAGEGHPVVLAHAAVSDHRMWDAQFALFAERYRVIRYDLRGFGRSLMPAGPYAFYRDLHGLLEALGIRRAHLIGVSASGEAVVECAIAYPDMVASIIPVAAGLIPSKRPTAAQAIMDQIGAAYEAKDADRIVDLEMRLWLIGPERAPEAVSPALQQRFVEIERPNIERELQGEQGAEEGLEPPAGARLSEIRAPVLAIAGDADLPNARVTAEAIAAQVPGARSVILPNVAHMVPQEAPEEFNRLALEFLAGL